MSCLEHDRDRAELRVRERVDDDAAEQVEADRIAPLGPRLQHQRQLGQPVGEEVPEVGRQA